MAIDGKSVVRQRVGARARGVPNLDIAEKTSVRLKKSAAVRASSV